VIAMILKLLTAYAMVVLITSRAGAEVERAALPVAHDTPTAADGAPTYQPQALWLDGAGQSWQLMEAKSGHAAWVLQDPAAALIDEVGGSGPVAAYGTRRLTSDYHGPALNLYRIRDSASRDIGFLQDGGLDETVLASFCARTECRVTTWYDQSGNRQDAVQTDIKSQPVVRLGHRIGNSLSLVWDYEATSGQSPRWLVLPPALKVIDSAMSILWTGRFHSASLMSPILELGIDSDPFSLGFWDAHGSFYIGTPDQLAAMPAQAPLSSSIGVISSSADEGLIVNYRNKLQRLGSLRPKTHQGGYLGMTIPFRKSGMMELSSLIIYGRAFGADDRLHAAQALEQNFKIPQQHQDTYVADGDSITQGLGSPYLQGYPWHMEHLLPASFVLYNAGWAAKTLGGTDGLIDRYGSFTSKLYNPNARTNILSLLAGTNDIQDRSSGQEVFQLIQQYATAARRTGFKVIVGTILPRSSFDGRMEYERVQANILLRSNWQKFADGLADIAADPTLGSTGAPSNISVYCSDGIHPTNYGYQLIAANLSMVVIRLLQE
jgi:lysophospholipase L1-like esterase